MKETPKGWPRISPSIFYNDAKAAIDWLCRVFGFETRLLVEGEGGRVEHSELVYGDGLIMVGQVGRRDWCQSPEKVGANTMALCIVVDNADEHCEKARAAGAEIAIEPETHDYGDDYWADRTYLAVDPEGHRWWFMQRVRG